ncbi:hypothetical protein HQO24_10465 [Rhodococcus fascians]|nr:hypothetical protein [Rhodococcus fascians]MBY4396896.1 hypothetical protein [Rhodococcus fascians]MBY4407375.1 hypothetical protein [Rhodococcus fascians]MBY4421496.1 hypothetical protein [Rhodococcus fascians]MBY4460751.1 hypothetical protein [Rhodococcus fascians]
MAVVSFKDSDGVERWADDHSKAYEKHLKSVAREGSVPAESEVKEPAKAEQPQANPAPRVLDVKPEAKKV